MNQRLRHWLQSVTLVLLALAAGISWRRELEWRSGWAGMAWVNDFRWTVPICVSLFIVWTGCFAGVRRPFLLTVVLTAFAWAAYTAIDSWIRFYFVPGSIGIAAAYLGAGKFNVGLAFFWIVQWAAPLLWSLIPLLFCLICRSFGTRISMLRALLSAVFFTLSWPLAVFVRSFFEEIGSPDLIHALKSGFVIPFLVVSLGFPLPHSLFAFSHNSSLKRRTKMIVALGLLSMVTGLAGWRTIRDYQEQLYALNLSEANLATPAEPPSWRRHLPATATEVQEWAWGDGSLPDYTYLLKARITASEFQQFVETLGLTLHTTEEKCSEEPGWLSWGTATSFGTEGWDASPSLEATFVNEGYNTRTFAKYENGFLYFRSFHY